jgi:hypothetical protein
MNLRETIRSFEWRGIKIPQHCQDGLVDYVNSRILPGSFLCAVLHNDLAKAFVYADDHNIDAIGAYVAFLYTHCPAHCWGSVEKVNRYIDQASR